MSTTRVVAVPRARRHTLHFLAFARAASPVYLDTEIDVTALTAHRRAADRRYSVVTYVLLAVGAVVSRHPQAGAAVAGRWRPRLALPDGVDVKLTLDKQVGDVRTVFSAVLPDVERCSLDHLQNAVDRLRDTPVDQLSELDGARALHRMPVPLGRVVFRLASGLRARRRRLGTVALTSLGHRPVRRFFSSGGTALTVGLGRITPTPVVVDEEIVVRPMLPLSLTFDHRVLDGALAADVLAELKAALEEPHVSPRSDDATVAPAARAATGSGPGRRPAVGGVVLPLGRPRDGHGLGARRRLGGARPTGTR